MTRGSEGTRLLLVRTEDPLESWLSFEAFSTEPDLVSRILQRAEPWLAAVAQELDRPDPKYPFSSGGFPARLPPRLLAQAEALYRRVWDAPGTNKHDAEYTLLSSIGFTAAPTSIPFWKATLALSKPRDGFAAMRRRIAAAAFGYMAMRGPKSNAFAELEALAQDARPEVRLAAADALATLVAVMEESDPALAARAIEVLQRVAAEEEAPFLSRFLARRFLARRGEPLPAWDRSLAIAFEVSFGGARRTIELAAEQTLQDLHFAILNAFEWDADHLHCFALNGVLHDPRFSIPGPDDMAPFLDDVDPSDREEASFALGAMGLPVKHAFLYLYDFGDNNVFRIKVQEMHPKSPKVKYPRVTKAVGKTPDQYPESEFG